MSPKFLSIILGLSLLSCAHIQPMNGGQLQPSEEAVTEARGKSHPVVAATTTLAKEPVYQKSENNFLERRNNTKVKFWIEYFSVKNKDRFERFIANGEKYKPLIEETFERYGLPKELYYVGLIESGYYNAAKSHAGAVGPWQFMPSTARRYGLRVNKQIDERKNIFKSTEAAALFFQDLYNIFGSWELALAAYNKGENGVIRRIRGANTRDYYELSAKKVLPKETRHYVPKVLAVMHILENSQRYQVVIKKWDHNPFTQVVKMEIDKPIKISTIAKNLNISPELIKKLNQDIRYSNIPNPGKRPFELYLPQDAQTAMNSFKNYLATIKQTTRKPDHSSSSVQIHKVRKNESLYALARRYNTTVSKLKRLNGLKRSTIFVGQKIKVTSNAKSEVLYSYIVKSGDNLSKIAALFSLKTYELKKLNKKNSSKIMVGERLKVPPYRVKTHTVKSGEYLGKIARSHNIKLSHLRRINPGLTKIFPGQKINLSFEKI